MVIFTAKVNKPKLIAILVAAAAIILFVIFLSNRGTGTDLTPAAGPKLSTPEDRVAYLSSQGYQVTQDPVKTQEVLIPKEFTEVYTQYNALQQSQGFDLTKYRGKRVMQYVYLVETDSQESGDPVYATLLIYKNKLIGGDLSRSGTEGFLRPLLGT